MAFFSSHRRGRYGMGDTAPIAGAGDLQSITGANVPVDAEHVSALQRELNRFSDPKSPFAIGAPLAVTGVLDDATASRAVGLMMFYLTTQTTDPSGFMTSLITLPLASSQTRIDWVTAHITTVYSTAKAFADAKGLPAATGIPLAVVVGAVVVGAYLLFGAKGSKRKGKRR
jgi:hypothetical protein